MDKFAAAESGGKKPFLKPELEKLQIERTGSGPVPDPFEFPMILQMS